MGTFRDWARRRRVLAAFAAGVLLTLAALAAVGYLVLADQRRSARVLAAALTQALRREVEIERVTDLGPSRVVLRGLRLSTARGWPAEVKAESVEVSGPLLSAARGEAAPVRILVTRPTVSTGGAAGAATIEEVRQSLASFVGSAALLDLAVTGGVLEVPGSASEGATFDALLHKGSDEARGEVVLRNRAGARFTLGLHARVEGDTIRLDLSAQGGLDALSPWLPATLAQAGRTAPVDVRAQLGLSPGDRAAGRASTRLGDVVALEGALSFQDKLLRLSELRGTADLGLAGSMASLAGPVAGHVELADGEVTWSVERGGWPEARVTLHLLDATLPASAVGVDVLARGVEARLALEPHEGGMSARGELRGERVEVAGLALAPVATPLRIDLDSAGTVSRVELAGLTAQVFGTPVRGTVAYDLARGRADAQVEMSAARLDALARGLGRDWLGPSDQLHAGSVRAVVTGLDPRGWSDGNVDLEVSGLALRQAAGEAAVDHGHLRATVRSGGASIRLEAERVRGGLPFFQGLIPRVQGSADVARDGGGATLARATLVARDEKGQDMFQADLGRPTSSLAGPVRLTVRAPTLERLVLLWPSVPREVIGSGSAELESPDLGFGTYAGHVTLRVASAELLGGKLSLRDVSAEVPLRRGGPPAADAVTGGSLQVGELVGYGAVLYDLTGRPRALDGRLTFTDLHYGLYSGQGGGAVDLDFAGGGPVVQAHLTGEGVRIEEFMAAYGIRGGTMTGLMRFDLKLRSGGERLGADGRFEVPEGGTVTIELLDRLLGYAQADPSGVMRRALGNLRAFDYKAAEMTVRTASDDIRVTVALQGRERFGIFPPRVKEINVRDMPLGFLARQFPGQ